MTTKFTYAIKYVSDMERAVRFHKEALGLTLKFESPEWSEFDTGQTILALHPANPDHPAGSAHLGFAVPDLKALYAGRGGNGLDFLSEPAPLHGALLARLKDGEGGTYTLSGPI
jgi:catechol 2,3-dioxygenase-like lactoylglutathione lyase family enzyme